MSRPFPETGLLISASAILDDFRIVPDEPGVYAWFFRPVPPHVPWADCLVRDGHRLLYVGIAPRRRISGRDRTRRTLRERMKNHLGGNIASSTLRISLAALLKGQKRIAMERTAHGSVRIGEHERKVTSWMAASGHVVWLVHPRPWEIEEQLMRTYSLPLNIKGNGGHPFARELRLLRRALKSGGRA
jgi:hypothetical protein